MEKSAQIELLQKQLNNINDPDFDLESWKTISTTLLSKIFEKEDERIRVIAALKIDYGSWTLRDASANYDPLATCKKKAQGIMEISIQELKMDIATKDNVLNDIFNQHLTGKQFKELREIVNSKSKKQEKTKQLTKKLQSLKMPLLSDLLSDILLNYLK